MRALVEQETGIERVRGDTLGYLQRCFPTCISETDQAEAREVGEKAAQYALWHNMDGSVAIQRIGDYAVEYFLAPLQSVAATERRMPRNFMNKKGNNVTSAFMRYARPLIGPLPKVARIAAPPVKKIRACDAFEM